MKKRITAILLIAVLLLIPATNMTVFAEDKEVVELYALPINGFYSQASDSPAKVYEESDGNQYLRLSYKNSDYATFYFDIANMINQDGIYKFEADIRYNADLETNNVFMTVFGDNDSQSQTVATDMNTLNSKVTSIKNSDWKKLSFTFTIEDYFLKSYQYFKFGFNTMGLAKNYIDIDNINISWCSPMEFGTKNIDENKNGDFEAFESEYAFGKIGWHGNETYYVSASGLENQIVSEGGNRVLKLFTSDGTSTSITKSLNLNIAKSGWYKLSFKVKAGADFYTNNIGFRISDNTGVGAHVGETKVSYTDINSKEWVTVETPFYVDKASSSPWLNMDLWVFTHNDDEQYQSENNYLLLDEIKIVKRVSGGIYGENLFGDGEISGFKESQGQQIYNIVYGNMVKDYPYIKEIISTDTLEQFGVGKKFTTNRAEENWWGTTSNDISAEMVDIDGYHAALMAHDGKQVTKTFSSLSYVFNLEEFSTKKYYTLEFDYKLQAVDTDVVRVAFIGTDNKDDYMMDLANATAGVNYTQGVNKDLYSYVIEEKEDGWCHLRLIFKPNIEFKSRVTTLRFLNYTNFNEENKFYVANIAMTEHSDTEYPIYASDTDTAQTFSESDGIGSVIGVIGIVTSVVALMVIIAIVISYKRKGGNRDEKK